MSSDVEVKSEGIKSNDVTEEENTTSASNEESKQAKIDKILSLKEKSTTLLTNVRYTKALCDKYENENQYLQDYIGSLMQNNELNK